MARTKKVEQNKEIDKTKTTKTAKSTTTKKTTTAKKDTKTVKATTKKKTTSKAKAAPAENTNDQGDIIKYIKNGEYDKVWEKVKFVGYRIIPDMEDRYILFHPIISAFKYKENNNFIKFYLSNLGYIKSYQNQTFLTTSNRGIIKTLIRQGISPDEEKSISKMVTELSTWESGGIID